MRMHVELMGDGFSHAGRLARLVDGSKEGDNRGAGDGGDTVKAWPVLAWWDAVDATGATMAGTSRRHALEVGVARAPQCHKWHGDGGLASCVQRPGRPMAQRSDAMRQQRQRCCRGAARRAAATRDNGNRRGQRDVASQAATAPRGNGNRRGQRDVASQAATAPRGGSPRWLVMRPECG